MSVRPSTSYLDQTFPLLQVRVYVHRSFTRLMYTKQYQESGISYWYYYTVHTCKSVIRNVAWTCWVPCCLTRFQVPLYHSIGSLYVNERHCQPLQGACEGSRVLRQNCHRYRNTRTLVLLYDRRGRLFILRQMIRFQSENVSSLKRFTLASTNQLESSLPPLLRGSEAAESTCTRTQESTTPVVVIPCP